MASVVITPQRPLDESTNTMTSSPDDQVLHLRAIVGIHT
jgi:hypothetical protein